MKKQLSKSDVKKTSKNGGLDQCLDRKARDALQSEERDVRRHPDHRHSTKSHRHPSKGDFKG